MSQKDEAVEAYVSPDGLLRLLVFCDQDDDTMIGFDGFQWHTHASLLAGWYATTEEVAVRRFVDAILSNCLVIAVSRRGDEVLGAWVTFDPETDVQHTPPDESLDLRFWDGTRLTGDQS